LKILFLDPPRRVWPYMNHEDNYLTRQAYLCLAASLRQAGFTDVAILDCMPLKMGWLSLERELRSRRPDLVLVGENHALYADEALKALDLAREVLPGVVTVAGGAHFTHLCDAYLGARGGARSAVAPKWLVRGATMPDYIVKGEGDLTVVELARHVESGSRGSPDHVAGLAFARDGVVVHTAPRDLVHDLDSLPMPAYDLVPMDLYGKSRLLFSPGGTTIHHSRGCAHACSFCVWWTQMARRKVGSDGVERLSPAWRTFSPERTVDEMELLSRRYGKRGLVFVDDCFNLDPKWSQRFAERVLRRGIKVNWFAFLRADYLVRDHELGVLDALVRAGLRHVSIGAERVDDADLSGFGKRHYDRETTVRAFEVLRKHHPEVFRQATFIVGIPGETRESMWQQWEFARELRLDYPGFHPLTPVPGTRLWDEAMERGTIQADTFGQFDWSTPVMATASMSRREVEEVLIDMGKRYVTGGWLARGLLTRHSYKRAMYQWFLKVSAAMAVDMARRMIRRDEGPLVPLVEPDWYHS